MCTGFPSYIGNISLSSTFSSLAKYGSTKTVVSQALVSLKKYMTPPFPYFKVNICPLPLPHVTSIFFNRRSWHGLTTPLFSNFLFTNLFSIKFLYFFIISSLFPYFNLFVSIFIQSYANIKLHVSTLYRY